MWRAPEEQFCKISDLLRYGLSCRKFTPVIFLWIFTFGVLSKVFSRLADGDPKREDALIAMQ